MTSPLTLPSDLSDRDLLDEVERAALCERHATAHLVALLCEVDSRKLYAGQGFSSLFAYCVQQLHLSEHAAYLRIEAARAARRFPAIRDKLADGSLHLTAVSLLAPHLTAANHVAVLESATHKSKRDVEQLVARLRPQPDVPSMIRRLPAPASPLIAAAVPVPKPAEPVVAPQPVGAASPPAAPSVIKPLAPERYKVQFTVSHETHEKLRRVQDLMRHANPTGDVSMIFDRSLTLLLDELSKARCGVTTRPRNATVSCSRTRHIPAAIKRKVWARDGGRCAFRGAQGRCTETGFLEFHHLVPYADGGQTTADNLELRCRPHNQYDADLWSGELQAPQARATRGTFGV